MYYKDDQNLCMVVLIYMATELEYEDIIHYNKTGSVKYQPGLSDDEKRNIREKASIILLGNKYIVMHMGGIIWNVVNQVIYQMETGLFKVFLKWH